MSAYGVCDEPNNVDIAFHEIVVADVHQEHPDRPVGNTPQRLENTFDLLGPRRLGILKCLNSHFSKRHRRKSDVVRLSNLWAGAGRAVSGVESFLPHHALTMHFIVFDEVRERFLLMDWGKSLLVPSQPAEPESITVSFDDGHNPFLVIELGIENSVD